MGQELSMELAADTPFGHDVFGLRWTDGSGAERTFAPAEVTGSCDNADICNDADVRYVDEASVGLHGHIMLKNSAAAGAVGRIRWSVADGDVDDIILNVTIGADRLIGDASGITVTQRAEALLA